MSYRLQQTIAINATASSDSITSDPIEVNQMTGYSVQYVVSSHSSYDGTFKVQGSNDKSNWTDITDTSDQFTNNGSNLINVEKVYYSWIRVVLTRAAGSATVKAIVVAKGL